jgi:hypothetical protein
VSLRSLLQLKCTARFIFDKKDSVCSVLSLLSQQDDSVFAGFTWLVVLQQLEVESSASSVLFNSLASELVEQQDGVTELANSVDLLLQPACFLVSTLGCFDAQQLDAACFSTLFSAADWVVAQQLLVAALFSFSE